MMPTLRSSVIEVAFPPVADARLAEHLAASGITDATLAERGFTLDQLVRVAGGDIARARALAAGGAELDRHRGVAQVAAGLAAGRMEPSDATSALLGFVD